MSYLNSVVPEYKELVGRVAVVTGAARGMGAYFAAGLARQGVNVLCVDIDESQLQATTQEISKEVSSLTSSPGELIALRCNVLDNTEVNSIAAKAIEKYGRLDIWVSNAGIFPQSAISEMSPEQINQTFGINVNGVIYGAQAASEYMSNGGVIINMASVAAFRVRPGRAIYSATKAAVNNLTKSLAVELGTQNIRVNALAPGFINTDMTNWVREIPGAMEKALSTVPLGRIGEPSDVMSALLFLVSDSAAYITGQTLGVDGGSVNG